MPIENNVEIIKNIAGENPIEVGFILGSGLGDIAQMIKAPSQIPYEALEGFPHAGVSGHSAQLTIGNLHGVRVAILGGRAHYYEKGDASAMFPALKTLKALGANLLFVTNSAGSTNNKFSPGDLMLIKDHINFSGLNPLIGVEGDERFVDLGNAYDEDLRNLFQRLAQEENTPLLEGVYTWFSGPSFETRAEIKMVQSWGADAVGMSTVPEIIMARYLKMKCIGVSNITNMAAGLSDEKLSHEHTKTMALKGARKLEHLIKQFLKNYRSI